MENDIIGNITEETKEKLRDFDEQEAYFLLCEIFSYAQATKDYAKFQIDLTEWKKRFSIELFSETYKAKIKYMLSKEFLDTVLKNFIAFDELSKKDPAEGLEKLRKILHKAEKHKDAKELDKDLDGLYKEFPMKYLKEKYPHIVGQLLSKSNRTRILEKFDSSLAFKELDNIVQHPDSFDNVDDFKNTIEEWQKLYPTADFNDKYRDQVEKTLTETLDSRKLEELFPVSTELDLNLGEIIPIELKDSVKDISILSKDALYEFFKIVDKNKGDVDSLFKWICKYNRYINGFDPTIKTAIVDSLMTKYAYELPPVNTKYEIPKMSNSFNNLLSLSDYNNIDDTKKQVLLQLLGILSTGKELSNEDIYRISIIDSNVKKVETIQKAKMEPKVQFFMEKFPEDKLTPSDDIYLEPVLDTSLNITFKDTLKVDEPLEKVSRVSGSSSSSDNGNNSGGWSSSIALNTTDSTQADNKVKEASDTDKEETDSLEDHTIKAVILEHTNFEDKETIVTQEENTEQRTNPVKNFFNRFIKRDTYSGDDRDDR